MVEEHKKANPPEDENENALGSNANLAEPTSAAAPDVLDSILDGILDDSDDDGPLLVKMLMKLSVRSVRMKSMSSSCSSRSFTTCAILAAIFLAIPAASAPSERVWSRAARILTATWNRMKQDVTQAMMFCRENKNLLHKHFALLAKERMAEKDHWLIDAHKALLPTFEDDDEDENIESNIDVGGEEEDA